MRAKLTAIVLTGLMLSSTAWGQDRSREQISDEPTFAPPPVLTNNFITAEAAAAEIAPLAQPYAECCPHCHCHSCECPLQPAPCNPCPHVSTLFPFYNVSVFGALQGNMLFNTARPVGPGTPFFLAPGPAAGLAQNTVDLHARSTSLGAAVTGPEMGNFKAGGVLLFMFYDEAIVLDIYGFLPVLMYGELKNEDWRFAAGLQFDVFNPNLPTMLTFSSLIGSGNSGNLFKGQFRAERYYHPSDNEQWTIQAALSEPISTTITNANALNEDNGWPNVEGRIAYGVGTPEQVGLEAKRPFEVGVSGVVGQVRTTQLAMFQVVANVCGVGADMRWKINDRCGIVGEVYSGQGLGNYGGGILQTTNTNTFEAIRSAGAWGEFWYYWNPCLHSHIGYGVDDPVDRDTVGPIRNETYFANLLWDVNKSLRVGFEFTWRETAYRGPIRDNEGAGFHTQVQWSF
jgi:hypothetical protein